MCVPPLPTTESQTKRSYLLRLPNKVDIKLKHRRLHGASFGAPHVKQPWLQSTAAEGEASKRSVALPDSSGLQCMSAGGRSHLAMTVSTEYQKSRLRMSRRQGGSGDRCPSLLPHSEAEPESSGTAEPPGVEVAAALLPPLLALSWADRAAGQQGAGRKANRGGGIQKR